MSLHRNKKEFRYWNTEKEEMVYGLNYFNNEEGKLYMQYSEMKDVDGVKIFEGDFVEYFMFYKHIKQVWFKDGSFRLMGCRHSSSKERNHIFSKKVHAAKLRVIGNVFQNPELLPKQQSKTRGT